MVPKERNKAQKCVLQVLPALNSGGVERGVIDVAIAAKNAGFKSIVVSNGGAMTQDLKENKIHHIQIPLHSKNPVTMFFNIGRINKIIRNHQVDLIHIRSRAPAWVAYLSWLQFRKTVKIISTVHGSYSLNFVNKCLSKLKLKYNSVMVKPKFIIAVSGFIKNYIFDNYSKMEDLSDKEMRVIHRGADVDYFNKNEVEEKRVEELRKNWKIPKDKTILMLPARMSGWKGHEFLINALKKLEKQDFMCLMVGNTIGHEKFTTILEDKIRKNGLENKVKIVGQAKDMPAAYLVADVIISASTKPEAFGRIAIEAGAMEKIIVATNIGGSLETVIDGETGFLVKNNDVDDLAEKIDLVLNLKKSEKEKIQKKASKHIRENFSNKKMLDKTIEFYHSILD
ncbi:MAG: glycosyltransferase involved in cell wall biosynthesis [Lentimonas sp.]|jgi:glycosyltransferase involved in cell wall biosynthesis